MIDGTWSMVVWASTYLRYRSVVAASNTFIITSLIRLLSLLKNQSKWLEGYYCTMWTMSTTCAQLSNLWWMPNSLVSNGFGTAMHENRLINHHENLNNTWAWGKGSTAELESSRGRILPDLGSTLWCQLEDMFQLIVTPQGIEKVMIQLKDTPTKVYAIGAELFLSKVPLEVLQNWVLILLIVTPHILGKVQGQIKEVCRLIEPCLIFGTREQ